jgi:hypothetical protein
VWFNRFKVKQADKARALLSARYQTFPFRLGGVDPSMIHIHRRSVTKDQLFSEAMWCDASGEEVKILEELAAWAPPGSKIPHPNPASAPACYRWIENGRQYLLMYHRNPPDSSVSFGWQLADVPR